MTNEPPLTQVFGGGDPNEILDRQKAEAYLNDRTLSLDDDRVKAFVEVVRPSRVVGFPEKDWYDERKLSWRHVFRRVAIGITYQNPFGKPYEDADGGTPYVVARLLGPATLKDGTLAPEKPKIPKILAPRDRPGEFHFPRLDPEADGTYQTPPHGMRMCYVESGLKAQAVYQALRIHVCGGNGVSASSETKRGNEFMLHMIPGFDIKAYAGHILIPDSSAFESDNPNAQPANPRVQAAHKKMVYGLRMIAECRLVYEVNIGPHPETLEHWGPDDFLRYYNDQEGGEGDRRLGELIFNAPVAQAEPHMGMVKAMNQLAVYATDNGLIYDIEDGIGRDIGAAQRKYRPYGLRSGDKFIHAVDEWLGSHSRNIVVSTGYEYLAERMFQRPGEPERFNMYRPSGIQPGFDYEYNRKDRRAHGKFMRGPLGPGQIIFRAMCVGMGDWADISLAFSWLRYCWLTNQPLKVFLALFGPEGFGKGYWLQVAEKLIGEANAKIGLDVTTYLKNFNDSWFYSRLLAIGESKPSYEQRIVYADRVKGHVGDGKGFVEGKFRKSKQEPISWGLIVAANDINDLPRSKGAGRREALIDFSNHHFAYDFDKLVAVPEPVPKWGKGNPGAAASWNAAYVALTDIAALEDFAAWVRDSGEIDDVNMATFRADEMETREHSAFIGKSDAGKAFWAFRTWLLESGLAAQKPVWMSHQLLEVMPELREELTNKSGKTSAAFKTAAVDQGEWLHSENSKATEGAVGGLLGASRSNAYFVSEEYAQSLTRAEAVEYMEKLPTAEMLIAANRWKENRKY